MEIKVFEQSVTDLREKWNLPALGWKWQYNSLKRTLGQCNYREKKLFFSTEFIPINPPEIIFDVIKHEIAHALVGPTNRHNNVWKRKAIEVGARPETCQNNAVSPEGRYILECECGEVNYMHRRPKYLIYRCTKCRSRVFVKENNVQSKSRLISSILESVQ